jgi:hypothetical protein
MADKEQKIRYVIEIVPDPQAEPTIRKLAQQTVDAVAKESEAQAPNESQTRATQTPAKETLSGRGKSDLDLTLEEYREVHGYNEDAKRNDQRISEQMQKAQAERVSGQQKAHEEELKSRQEFNKSMSDVFVRLQTQATAAAFGFASQPGISGIGLGIGSALGGTTGIAIAGLSQLAEKAREAATALAPFNAQLFSTMTGLELQFMALKYQLAREVGPELSDFIKEIGNAASVLEPVASVLIKYLTPTLTLTVASFELLVSATQLAIGSITTFADYLVKTTTGYGAKQVQTGLVADFANDFSKRGDILGKAIQAGTLGQGYDAARGVLAALPITDLFFSAPNSKVPLATEKGLPNPGTLNSMNATDITSQSFSSMIKEATGAVKDVTSAINKDIDERRRQETIAGNKLNQSLLIALGRNGSALAGQQVIPVSASFQGIPASSRTIPDVMPVVPRVSTNPIDMSPDSMPGANVTPGGQDQNNASIRFPANKLPTDKNMVNDKSVHADHIDKAAHDSKGMPRPSPAAITMKTADTIKFELSDEDRLLQILNTFGENARRSIGMINDGRFNRLHTANLAPRGMTHGG